MGLTIHYHLKYAGTGKAASSLVNQLHQAAQDLPFKEIGDIVDLSGTECDFDKRGKEDPLRWLLIQSSGDVRLKNSRPVKKGEQWDSSIGVPPKHIIAFTAWPGDGCEESNFGLCQYPAEIFSPSLGTLKTRLSGWSWSSFCKTQYASDPNCGGVQNFLRCHFCVIAMLDKAKELGCLEQVKDEGEFWENRNVETLAEQIGSWNQMIAALGGKLKDVLGAGLEMPIAEYPNFEQLEMMGQSKLPANAEVLAKLIQQVLKKP